VKANKREKLNARRRAFEDAKNKKATLENIVKAILNATKSICWLSKGFSRGENLHD
jgi:hypothetical protein